MKVKAGLSLFSTIVLALTVFLAGCGSKTTTAPGSKPSGGSASSKGSTPVAQPLVIDAGETGQWQENFLTPFQPVLWEAPMASSINHCIILVQSARTVIRF